MTIRLYDLKELAIYSAKKGIYSIGLRYSR